MATIELIIANRLAQGLQSVLSLTPQQCYPIARRLYVPGFGQRALQIEPGNGSVEGAGRGGQDGGMIQRKLNYTLWVWYRFPADMHLMSQDIITQETNGFLDYLETVRSALTYTYLGDDPRGKTPKVLVEPFYYVSETATQWEDAKNLPGVAYRGITFVGSVAEVWSTTPAMPDSLFS